MAVGYLTEQNINIARGLIRGASVVHKFGRNPSIGGAPETVWMYGGTYTYLSSASTVYVSGADAQDSAAGTGARTVTVQGLDATYNEIEETLTVDGAVSTKSFLRVYRAFVASAGSLQTNKGNVLVSTGASGGGTVLRLLPPSSSVTELRFLAASAITSLPTAGLPVKKIWSKGFWVR